MAIPKFNEIRIQALKMLQDGTAMKIRDFIVPLAKWFGLGDEEVNAQYASGNGNIFYDRISWALSYLYLAHLIDKPQRGVYKINAKGIHLLDTLTPAQINDYVEKTVQSRSSQSKEKSSEVANESPSIASLGFDNHLTPQENLYRAFDNIKKSVYSEILATIVGKTPEEFERLVVMLLKAMGYGGEVKDSGYVTRAVGDGGIDGIVKEDVLGFGRIYIQAKRYAADITVQRPEVQKFVGALAVAQSNKGVFITTSCFSKGAVDYVKSLNGSPTIVLMDGKELAEYIYEYGLGMQTEQIVKIKKLDADFWDSMKDDQSCVKKQAL